MAFDFDIDGILSSAISNLNLANGIDISIPEDTDNPLNQPRSPFINLEYEPIPPPVINEIGERRVLVSEGSLNVENKVVNKSQQLLNSIKEISVNVVDEIYVEQPDIRNIEFPSEIKGGDFLGYDVDFDISFTTINTTYVRCIVNGDYEKEIRINPVGIGKTTTSFNVQQIIDEYFEGDLRNYLQREFGVFDQEQFELKIPFEFIPVNDIGREPVSGKSETFIVKFNSGDLEIPRSVAINRLAEGFIDQLDRNDDIFQVSKYLTHLLHLGDGDNKVITNWVGVDDGDEGSLVFKLYEPLPTSVQTNDKVWVSKLQSEPIIETITIVEDEDSYCTPLKGANFSIEVDNGIGFEVYNDLIQSGSQSSTSLVNEYTQKLGIDTEKLSIEYVSGSQIEFKNFTHFGSAEERVKNFWYKLELIESYISTLETISNSDIDLTMIPTNTGSILITGSNTFNVSEISLSPNQRLEADRVVENINKVVREFDGFEKFLYNDDSELAYPKTGLVLKETTENDSKNWYSNTVVAAKLFDRNNVHYINNNLPIHITTDYENEDFLLFMDMIGHHFDIIWSYINSLAKGKRLEHKVNKGITNELVYSMLESLGWETNQSYDSKFLWEYVFGQNRDSSQKYQKTLKSANEEVWRRILNNLPYLLKHKGTKRSLSAVLTTYGVPSYLLSIEEFGGPTNTEEQSMNYTFEDQTAAINFTGKESIFVFWKSINGQYPNTIELNLKFDEPQNSYLVKGGDSWDISTIQTTGSFGKIIFNLSGSTELKTLQTDEIRLFNDTYKQIVLTRTSGSVSSSFDLYVKEAKGDRIRISETKSFEVENTNEWGNPTFILIGSSSFDGNLDEFRLWKTSLTEDVINNHTLIPDAINGNSYTASSDDLWFRMDFEYPKNRNTDTSIQNVSISSEYDTSFGAAINFDSITEYPYNYTTYTRDVTAKVPLIGNTFSNKIRFEEQELITDLSYRQRATKKSFDRAPVDSPRLGIFLSPTKELNLTMLRSFGEFNIDNYIGNPSDRYSDTYTELKDVRDYFFQRITRNFNEYIQLVRYINKSLFKDLENLIPSRAKVSKGLLIEPHLLERSKVRWNKPQSERNDYETSINVDETNTIELEYGGYEGEVSVNDEFKFQPEYNTYESEISAKNDIQLNSTYDSLETLIDYDLETELSGENLGYELQISAPIGTTIQTNIDITDFSQIGFDLETGFGLYASASHGNVTTLDIFGNETSSRQEIYLVKERYTEKVEEQTGGWPLDSQAIIPTFEIVDKERIRYKITKIPFGGNEPTVGGNILEVTPLNGYFPSHYKFKNNLSEGLRRSFFKGSTQTESTTPDGLPPVEILTTNPNILRVADTGRGSNEPILITD